MTSHRLHPAFHSLLGAAALLTGVVATAPVRAESELVAFALMPANTFSEGPTSGQFAGAGNGENALPLVGKQPVQGVSAVLEGPSSSTFYVMSDNGFGAQTNSADTLLRVYAVRPNFVTWHHKKGVRGAGTVSPAHFKSGNSLPSFSSESFITLSDPRGKLGFEIVADQDFYPNGDGTVPVDPSIRAAKWLTGADFDVESFRKDRKGNFWFGDEFGPFLVQTDSKGRVSSVEEPLPNIVPPGSTAVGADVKSPQNPYLAGATPNLGRSLGFEGMAVSPDGRTLYPLLEGSVAGDEAINGAAGKNLRIAEFDIASKSYTGDQWLYRLEGDGTNIGDMTAINDEEFLVIERNGGTATSGTPYKKIFIASIRGVAPGGFVTKTELVDLMNVQDPHDLNGDGSVLFTFPFVTIESVLILDAETLLVINDNNYPGSGGRDAHSDNTEFLKIRLDHQLDVAVGSCH